MQYLFDCAGTITQVTDPDLTLPELQQNVQDGDLTIYRINGARFEFLDIDGETWIDVEDQDMEAFDHAPEEDDEDE